MKKSIFVIVLGIALAYTPACKSPEQKVDDEAKKLQSSGNNYDQEWQNFKDVSEKQIAENDVKIEKEKEAVRADTGAQQEKDQERLDTLRAQNHRMKERIEQYGVSTKHDDWQQFKTDFNSGLDKINKAVDNITGANKNQK